MSTITASNCDDYNCPLISDKHGEPDTLDIIQQFRQVYENKLKQIDKEGCSDALQLKLKIQQKWIENLTEQTEMMARVVKELEIEAAERVQMLEDKLKRSAECASEVMRRYQMYDFQFNSDDYFQRVGYLENDLKNLLEFIRRVREDNRWSIEGLIFYDVDYRDLFGKDKQDCKCDSEMVPIDEGIGRGEEEVCRDNQDEIIERLRKENEYLRSAGNPKELLESLKKQKEQYIELKQNMVDMRQALTEEVACKHDLILLLKKDIQQLEERCLQADKQTAFKDDIIKELRKEIKQLKQQKLSMESYGKQETRCSCNEKVKKLEEDHQLEVSQLQSTISELRNPPQNDDEFERYLYFANQESNPSNSLYKTAISDSPNHESTPSNSVYRTALSDFSNQESNPSNSLYRTALSDFSNQEPNRSKLIRNKDEIIQLQNDTLNMIQIDLQEKKKKEKVLKDEIEKRQVEVDRLKEKCKQLEKNLGNTKEQTDNLQTAVDLYLNSINVLEASEERSKLEIEQQRTTITNLQEALVNVKHELDEIKGKNQQEFNNQQQIMNIMYMNLIAMETKRDDISVELSKITEAYKQLSDTNFELEVEHFNSLQDTAVLETQLIKYQNLLRNEEKTVQSLNCNLEVLQQEKSVHETIISYLKNEISTMSDELVNLQGILEISNQTCRDENQQLVDTVANLEEINQRLQSQLSDSRLKLFHENEANIQRIKELELILQEKDADLVMHDQEIGQLTQNLNAAMEENLELKNKISQMYFQIYENSESGRDNIIISEFNEKIQMLKEENQRKIDELCEENNQLRQILDEAKKELEQIRDTKEMSRSELNTIKEALQKKHEETKEENLSLSKKYEDIKSKLSNIAHENQKQLSEMKSKFDGILKEFKESLSKINKSLIDGKFAKNLSYLQKRSCCCNLIDSCKSEIQLTGKLIESFKEKYVQLSNNFNEVTQQNNQLINTLQHKDDEFSNTKQELQQTKKVKQQFDGYLNEILEFLRLEMKNVRDLQDFQPTTKQEEISLLKELIKEIFQEQIGMNKEKDRFLSQIDRLQTALNKHEDANRLLNSQFEANHLELKHLLDNNKLLKQAKDDINNELETLQNHCSCIEKRNRQLNETVKNLELELIQSKVKRDDICAESKLVIDCVRVWLNEQKKINNEIQQRKLGSFKVQQHKNSQMSSASTKATNCPAAPYNWNHCSRSDSVGCGSPASYSPDDDDDDDDDDDEEEEEDSTDDIDQDDDFIRRAKEITNQIRCSNQYFKSRFPNF